MLMWARPTTGPQTSIGCRTSISLNLYSFEPLYLMKFILLSQTYLELNILVLLDLYTVGSVYFRTSIEIIDLTCELEGNLRASYDLRLGIHACQVMQYLVKGITILLLVTIFKLVDCNILLWIAWLKQSELRLCPLPSIHFTPDLILTR